ncbi:restriction endonuclease subunit S [Pasteurella multocida]|uniref:restriction endonuclease subunit S n=1 Tax=Pasteurella multocida TaxID=747 RepID=UPI0003085C76|nr:restriction endonuclease subunit S [Pasteurella multocida]APW56275.1 HsdA [Pasteurella multocida subsp. multocida str. HN07]ARA70689.1 protein HsdA [Pasteurella multocida subsp. multocida]ARA89981.1 protein HsdA [Pasteurella multocida subsp. septica]AUL54064.1 protein HsdA [Pasteurella multocida]AWB55538.1 restriction endonuclease subunit S [Pasteurella multocida]
MSSSKVKLEDIVNFLNAKRKPLSAKERENRKGIYPYYGASDIVDYIDDYIFDGRYLLISEDGENLKTRKTPIAFIAEGKFWVNNHAHIISGKDDQTIDYLKYYFSNFDLMPFLTGAVQPKLSKGILEKIEIDFPCYEKRKRVNQFLGSLDNKIDLNTQTNQTLEQIAQAIFKSWFVDFDPVKAKVDVLANGGSQADAERAAMQVISGKTDAELTQMQQTQPDAYKTLEKNTALFPSEMVESELGNVPKGWGVSTIGDSVQTVGGATPSTTNEEFWSNGHIHWTTPKDLSSAKDKILLNTDRKITEAGLKKISSGLLPINTVLLSSRAPVGYLALTRIPVAINQGYIGIICSDKLSCYYVLQWCQANLDEIKGRASGTTFAEINKKTFREMRVLIPNNELIKVYDLQVEKLYKKITENIIESKALENIRDALLPKLLSGELHI